MAQINSAGLALIEQFEGCSLSAYQDSVGVWTIGYGHTGPDVHPGLVITQAQAQALLLRDVASAEAEVSDSVEIMLTPNEFSALVSFVFNMGAAAFRGSTMLTLLNQGNVLAAAQEFDRWVYAGGTELPGLVRRRAAEKALFLS